MPSDLILAGSPSYQPGKFGTGLGSGYAHVPDGVFNRGPLSNWTIECWGKRVAGPVGIFFSSLSDTFNQWYVGHNGSVATLNGRLTPAAIDDGAFHHFRLVLIAISGTQVLYVDGVCVSVQTVLAPGRSDRNRSYVGAIWSGQGEGVHISSPVVIDECAVFSSALTTGTSVGLSYFTPPATPRAGNEAGLVALWHLDGDGLDAAGATVMRPLTTVLASDPALLYSPGNWSVGTTVNPGAYVAVLYRNSGSVTLSFDVSGGASFAQIAYRFDGGPFITARVAAEVVLAAPAGRPQPRLLEVVFKSNFISYYGPVRGHATALTLQAIRFSPGAMVARPVARPASVLVFGDSITVGACVVSATGLDPDDNDATLSYAFRLREALGAEIGVIAFSGTGVQTSTPHAPALVDGYAFIFDGVKRAFSEIAPTFVVFLEGFNDGAAPPGSVASGLAAVISAIRSASPATRCLVLGDVGGTRSTEAEAAAAMSGAAYSASAISILSKSDDTLDYVHPTATAHLTKLLPVVAQAIREADARASAVAAWREPMEWEPSP